MLAGRIGAAISTAGLLLIALIFPGLSRKAEPQEASTPFPAGERLAYSIAWPSGLSVGEAIFRTRADPSSWEFELLLEASLPIIAINDFYRSSTDNSLCSVEFEKRSMHGQKQVHELLQFKAAQLERHNVTPEGFNSTSTVAIGDCNRDALGFLYYLRENLAKGRIPDIQQIFFGATYQLQLAYKDTRWLMSRGSWQQADEIEFVVTGPASKHQFTIHFGRDEARTPLLFQMEFEPGPFSMKLIE